MLEQVLRGAGDVLCSGAHCKTHHQPHTFIGFASLDTVKEIRRQRNKTFVS
jgi:hypothetical protein